MTAKKKIADSTIEAAKANIEDVIGRFVQLKRHGNELVACCPFHDEKSPSFTVTPHKGFYYCFGCGASGNAIDFVMNFEGKTFPEAIERITGSLPEPEHAILTGSTTPRQSKPSVWRAIRTAPADAPAPTFTHWRLGQPTATWCYRDPAGGVHGYVCRFEFAKEDGSTGKETVPLTWAVNSDTGETSWRWLSFTAPRPMYGLEELAKRPRAKVLIVEGEKTRDAAAQIFPGFIVITWPGGGKAVPYADFTPLAGRVVTLWPDWDWQTYKRGPNAGKMMPEAEQPGIQAMRQVWEAIKPIAAGVRIVPPMPDTPNGWDLADAPPMPGFDPVAYGQGFVMPADEYFAEHPDLDEHQDIPGSFETVETANDNHQAANDNEQQQTGNPSPLFKKHGMDSFVIAQMLKGKVIYDEFSGKWFEWDQIWTEISEGDVRRTMIRVMDVEFNMDYNQSAVAGTYKMLQDRLGRSPKMSSGAALDTWNTDRNLLPMINGVLNLETGELLEHSPDLNMNWRIPHHFERDATCPTVEAFLEQLSSGVEADLKVLYCFMAAVMRGMSNLQKYLELVGMPGTGKSTYQNLCQELVGADNFMVSTMTELNQNRFETANLFGKRLLIITDADKYGGKIDVFKSVTGQDPIRLEEKNKQARRPFIFGGMVMTVSNSPIQFSDASTAMVRRRVPYHLDIMLDDSKRDPHLLDKLKGEIPGLINRLMTITEKEISDVLRDVHQARIGSVNRALIDTHPLADWADVNLVLDPKGKAKIGSLENDGGSCLYPNYVEFSKAHGRQGIQTHKTFSQSLMELLKQQGINADRQRTKFGIHVSGVRLRDEVLDSRMPTLISKESLDWDPGSVDQDDQPF